MTSIRMLGTAWEHSANRTRSLPHGTQGLQLGYSAFVEFESLRFRHIQSPDYSGLFCVCFTPNARMHLDNGFSLLNLESKRNQCAYLAQGSLGVHLHPRAIHIYGKATSTQGTDQPPLVAKGNRQAVKPLA